MDKLERRRAELEGEVAQRDRDIRTLEADLRVAKEEKKMTADAVSTSLDS